MLKVGWFFGGVRGLDDSFVRATTFDPVLGYGLLFLLAQLLKVSLRFESVLWALEEETQCTEHVHFFVIVANVTHLIITV